MIISDTCLHTFICNPAPYVTLARSVVELYFHVKQVAQLHLSLVVADVLIVFEDSVVGIGSFCRCIDGRL